MQLTAYHKSLDSLHVGCEEPRAYFIPFPRGEEVPFEREKSPYFKTLCGEWRFRYSQSFEDASLDFCAEDFDASEFDKITVPSCWQTYLGRGYDPPLYSNERYPFPTDPPHVPEENPCGSYVRNFFLERDFASREVFLSFEGVSSCFYVFVNGSFVGYSQVSHCSSEFNISRFVREGQNKIAVLVVKWCDGSYLEDQDFFRLSGIFREVYLLARSDKRLRDVHITTVVSPTLDSAEINIDADLIGSDSVAVTIVSPSSETIFSGTMAAKSSIAVSAPELWSDETPSLYSLSLSVGDETVLLDCGIKRLEISDGVILLNEKSVKARGVNRHDTHPTLGYATAMDDMVQDLCLLKRANVNCIRTSHYPNDPRFPLLCSRMGFMLVDEADIETHGMGFDYGDWDWPRWSSLSDGADWEAAYVDRAARLFERDKNCACVVMWSLGNEAGVGNNHRAMARYIKGRNASAIIHYENSHKEFPCVPEGENYSDISDVESRMYADIDYQRKYLSDSNNKKPFFLCEYVDSTSTGDVYANWAVVEEFDKHFGACVWEFADHAVLDRRGGQQKYGYGGDFGDYPNDGICCVDGMVYPDRSPRPGYFDMKKVYEPFSVTSNGDGIVSITNKRYFTDLSDLSAVWSVTSDGETVAQGRIFELEIAPRCSETFNLFDPTALELSGCCQVNISFHLNRETSWAQVGCEMGFAQMRLDAPKKAAMTYIRHPLRVDDSERYLRVGCGETVYTFDKTLGRICSVCDNGRELISAPICFNLDRAAEYNCLDEDALRKRVGMHDISQKTYTCSVSEVTSSGVTVTAEIALGGPSVPPLIKGTVRYTFSDNGSVTVVFDGTVRASAPALARFGLCVITTEGFEQVEYFGYGPQESYVDRYRATRLARYRTTVTDNFEHYIRPRENGAHYGSVWGLVKNSVGQGMLFTTADGSPMSFGVSHFTARQLRETAHDCELVPMEQSVITLDYKITSTSGNSQIARIEPERCFNQKELSCSFVIHPFMGQLL